MVGLFLGDDSPKKNMGTEVRVEVTMSDVEFLLGWVQLVPGGVFLFVVLLSLFFSVKGRAFYRECSHFSLCAAGWDKSGTVEYARGYFRWVVGILFFLMYLEIFFFDYTIILNNPSLDTWVFLVPLFTGAAIFFVVYLTAFYSCVAVGDDKIWIVPVRIDDGIAVDKESFDELVIQDFLIMSLVYSPRWGGKRFVLVSKRSILKMIDE